MNLRKSQPMLKNKETSWGKLFLTIGGIIWIIRTGLALVFRPDYWNPQTAVDYSAAAGTTLALFLLAIGLWAIHLGRRLQGTFTKWTWLVGIGLACLGALVAGGANFFEDGLGIKAFGELFVWGSLAVFVGLLLAGISALRATDVSRWTGWLLIACALGFGFADFGGWFITGIALIVLGVLQRKG